MRKEALIVGNGAYVGLAPEGEAGSWQENSKVSNLHDGFNSLPQLLDSMCNLSTFFSGISVLEPKR